MIVNSTGIPILEQFSEEGFIDCVFKISDFKETADNYKFHIAAIHADEMLGMDVQIIKEIQSGFDEDMQLIKEHVYKKGVIFKRSGKESDRLISVLAKFYGLNDHEIRMIDEEYFTVIALRQGQLDMSEDCIKLKIFGRDSDEDVEKDRYYESFFHLYIRSGFVYWNEKDSDYRVQLISALSNKY